MSFVIQPLTFASIPKPILEEPLPTKIVSSIFENFCHNLSKVPLDSIEYAQFPEFGAIDSDECKKDLHAILPRFLSNISYQCAQDLRERRSNASRGGSPLEGTIQRIQSAFRRTLQAHSDSLSATLFNNNFLRNRKKTPFEERVGLILDDKLSILASSSSSILQECVQRAFPALERHHTDPYKEFEVFSGQFECETPLHSKFILIKTKMMVTQDQIDSITKLFKKFIVPEMSIVGLSSALLEMHFAKLLGIEERHRENLEKLLKNQGSIKTVFDCLMIARDECGFEGDSQLYFDMMLTKNAADLNNYWLLLRHLVFFKKSYDLDNTKKPLACLTTPEHLGIWLLQTVDNPVPALNFFLNKGCMHAQYVINLLMNEHEAIEIAVGLMAKSDVMARVVKTIEECKREVLLSNGKRYTSDDIVYQRPLLVEWFKALIAELEFESKIIPTLV